MAFFRRSGYSTRRRSYRRPYTRRSYPNRRAYSRPSSRRARPYSSRRRTTNNVHQARPTLSKYALAQINPFVSEVEGVKIPDANTAPGVGVLTLDNFGLTTSSSATTFGHAWAFAPSMGAALVTATPAASNAWTWPATYGGRTASAKQTSIQSNYHSTRPVAHGLRVSSPIAALTATGFLHVAVYPMNTFSQTTWNLPASLSEMTGCLWYNRYTISSLTQHPIIVVNKFLDNTSQRYTSTQSATDIQTGGNPAGTIEIPNEWCYIVIAVEAGIASTTMVNAECICHYEALPLLTGVTTGTPSAAFNPADMAGTGRVGSEIPPSYVDDGQGNPSLLQQGAQAFVQGAQAAAPGIGQALGNMAMSYAQSSTSTNNPLRLT